MSSRYIIIPLIVLFLFVIALSSLGAISAPARAEKSVTLQLNDRLSVTCESSIAMSELLSKQWIIRCNTGDSSNPIATPTTDTFHLMPASTAAPSTSVQGQGDKAPYASAPLCPTHDPNAWHGLWDASRGCHYDHEHGDDPSLADAYLGKAGALWGGQTISYPFATSAMENTMKHAGYKYSVRTPMHNPWPRCGTFDTTDNSQSGNNCIVASRIEYHAVGGTMDALSRYHSYYMEAKICKYPGYTECGIIRIGGHADFAELKAPHYNTRVVRPGGTVDFGDGMLMDFPADGADLPAKSGEPYVFMIPYSIDELAQRLSSPPTSPGLTTGTNATMDQWSMQDLKDCEPMHTGDPCHNQFARFLVQVGDSWNLIDPRNPNNIHWICKDQPGCAYNGSLTGANEIGFLVLQDWQKDGNGFVTWKGYTDRWGNPLPDGSCTSASVDCVPLVLEHVPAGYAASRMDDRCECVVYEHDLYFDGKPSGWIKFPN